MKKHILGILTITLLMFVGTNDSFAQNTEKETLTYEQQKEIHKQSRYKSHLEVWQKRLELTGEQVAAIQPGYNEYIAAAQALKSNTALTDEEKKADSATLRKAYDIELRKLLTEVQKEKLDQHESTRNNKK
ncbi:MAG: hypothetical protein ACI94Y_001953 [Maribacter sp.]|jgi:hypothetical protein